MIEVRCGIGWAVLVLLGLVLLGLGLVHPVAAIVVRHDRDDARYVELGSRYPAAVAIQPDGTGVLIAPRWVLTAGHIARAVYRHSPHIEIDGKQVRFTKALVHPGWTKMDHDLALFHLAKPVTDIEPVLLYDKNDETGQVVTFVGRGDNGNGLTGPNAMDRQKRGATNVVDRVDDQWLYFDFDRGDDATPLEGVSGPGDSGGPALAEIDGKLYTLGVSVFAKGKQGPGRYGVIEGYTRVSTHRQWILDAMAGKADAIVLEIQR